MNNESGKHKIGYLTIDDAPSGDFRSKVDFMTGRGVGAVFFTIGEEITSKKEQDLVYCLQKGFHIGNHSWSHADLGKLSEAQVREEILKTDKLIDRIYKEAGIGRKVKLFRFPYLNKGGGNREFCQNLLKDAGYRYPEYKGITGTPYLAEPEDVDISCTYDTMDWTLADGSHMFGVETFDDLMARMDEDVPAEGRTLNNMDTNDIIMMHDDVRIKEMFVPMIDKILGKGIVLKLPENM